jgi:hypothetical protein
VGEAAHQRHGSSEHHRHRPEETALYRVLEQHWPEFRARADEAGGLPRFVTREIHDYLGCGILERGLLVVACERCGFERLVAFSCKRRGFCPSCLGRRMNDVAVHLEEAVLPAVPMRQWVCSLPWKLRYLLGYDRELCAEVRGAFVGDRFSRVLVTARAAPVSKRSAPRKLSATAPPGDVSVLPLPGRPVLLGVGRRST